MTDDFYTTEEDLRPIEERAFGVKPTPMAPYSKRFFSLNYKKTDDDYLFEQQQEEVLGEVDPLLTHMYHFAVESGAKEKIPYMIDKGLDQYVFPHVTCMRGCHKRLGGLYEPFVELIRGGIHTMVAARKLGITRPCCLQTLCAPIVLPAGKLVESNLEQVRDTIDRTMVGTKHTDPTRLPGFKKIHLTGDRKQTTREIKFENDTNY